MAGVTDNSSSVAASVSRNTSVRIGSIGNRLGLLDVVLLGIACWFQPLTVLAGNPDATESLGRLAVLATVPWVVGVGTCWLLIRRGMPRASVVYTSVLVLMFLFMGGKVFREFGVLVGTLLIIAICALAGWLFYRMRDSVLPRAVVVGLAVALASAPLTDGLALLTDSQKSLVATPEPLAVQMTTTPDVFLVVADSYPGVRTWSMDFPQLEHHLYEELGTRGFALPSSAWAAYAWTHMSLPSLLQMDYPLLQGVDSYRTVLGLHEVLGGANRVREVFDQAGYETYMVEAGWSGSTCGDAWDHCQTGHFVDEAVFVALTESVFSPVAERIFGHSSTVGTRHTTDWLMENVQDLSGDSQPSFVFAHLLAPHPPFFLDRDCHMVRSDIPERRGVLFPYGSIPLDIRRAHFHEQRQCVDRTLLRIADLTDADDVVIFLSDHGPDSRKQLFEGTEWDLEATVERMNVMAAFRAADCDMGDHLLLPNVFRRLFSCLGGEEMPDLDARMWTTEMSEIDVDEVAALLGEGG